MKAHEKLIEKISGLYSEFGCTEWVKRNSYVLTAAASSGLAIAGSLAIAICRTKASKVPADLDFVCSSKQDAKEFIDRLESKLEQGKCYWSIRTNFGTKFCPPGSLIHYRIETPFWMPVCVMVINPESFGCWDYCQYYHVQHFGDVVRAAKALDERDKKGRVDCEIEKESKSVEIPINENIGKRLGLTDDDVDDSYIEPYGDFTMEFSMEFSNGPSHRPSNYDM